MKKFFKVRFNITKETIIALVIGIFTIGLSMLMNVQFVENSTILTLLVRDVLMIVGVGIIFVLFRIKRSELKDYGLTFHKGKRNIIINIVLAVLLAFVMVTGLKEAGKEFVELDAYTIYKSIFIILAGVFECMIFYTYQRVVFEKSFGKIPAILLVSMFYSFHHAGFQPEFTKLFFVGISFVLVVVLTRSIWSIFPFYWSVGALLDVLVQSEVVSDIAYPLERSIVIAVFMAIAFTVYFVKGKNKKELQERTTI